MLAARCWAWQACSEALGLRAAGGQVDAESAGVERRPDDPTRYHKVSHNAAAIAGDSVRRCVPLEAHRRPPAQIILDLDATDDPLHGNQEGRFFHGYYDCHCYLPLYIFCGRHLLAARLRQSNIDGAAGAIEEVVRIVARRSVAAGRRHVFCCAAIPALPVKALMAWCEANRVNFLFALARNERGWSRRSAPN